MNYVGPWYALVALLGLLALMLPPRLNRWLLTLGIVLGVAAFPALMLFYYGYFHGQAEFPLFYDIKTNWQAALRLYEGDGAVYAVEGSYSFPFPTYWLYWAATGFGAWAESGLFAGFTMLATCALGIALWGLWPELTRIDARYPDYRRWLWLAVLTVPTAQAIGQGQTATVVLACLVIFGSVLRHPSQFVQVMGGVMLAFAICIKPQLALIPLGLLIGREGFAKGKYALAGVIAGGLFWVGLTLLLPNGVEWSHYREFLQEVLPNLTPPTSEFKVHGSPVFLVSVLMVRSGVSEAVVSTTSMLLTGALVIAFLWRAWQQGWSPYQRTMFWAVWAIVAPQQSWNFYMAWGLPAVVLLLEDGFQRGAWGRLRLLFIALMLVNIQVDGTPLSVVTISIFAYLIWTYQSPAISTTIPMPDDKS